MPCGICGFVGFSDKKLLRAMCEVIKHRGPDETTYHLDDHFGLGVDRLSIIDLQTGTQPMHNEDESVWAIQNGEIYNYRELKAELEKRGHRFYTESDTETIVHAYEEWGDESLNHLRGMFALAVWDSKRRRLFLARDRFGKKPLYYSSGGGHLIFGSEMKALLQYEGMERRIDHQAVDLFFTYGYIPSPRTIFRGISKLQPGHYVIYEKGVLEVKKYWDMEFAPVEGLDEDAVVGNLYEKVREAVRLRLRSDVPLGAFLSGGIDSSTVVAFMSQLSTIPVKTVSIGFNDELSEVKYSRLVAEHLGTDHREYTVTSEAFKILPKLIWHLDEPFSDHSMIPTYHLSEVTRKEVTVALSGDGGDEMFMGYTFLKEPRVYRIYSAMPEGIRRAALKAIIRLPVKSSLTRMADHALAKDYGNQSPSERFVMRVTMMDTKGLERLYSQESLSAHPPSQTYSYMLDLLRGYKGGDSHDAFGLATIKSYLEEDILVKVDRMSMAASLEVRCPLLDQDLASFVATIPSHLKMRGDETKYIFKRMALKKSLLPREVIFRKKQGFGAPIHSWMGRDWKEVSNQVLDPVVSSNYTGLFNRESVRKMLKNPYVNANRIFALMVFVLWHRMYVDRDKLSLPAQGLNALA